MTRQRTHWRTSIKGKRFLAGKRVVWSGRNWRGDNFTLTQQDNKYTGKHYTVRMNKYVLGEFKKKNVALAYVKNARLDTR